MAGVPCHWPCLIVLPKVHQVSLLFISTSRGLIRARCYSDNLYFRKMHKWDFLQLSCKIVSALKLEQTFAESSNVEHAAYPWTPIFYPLASVISTDTPTIPGGGITIYTRPPLLLCLNPISLTSSAKFLPPSPGRIDSFRVKRLL